MCYNLSIILQRVIFSSLTSEDLKNADVTRKCLAFEPSKVTELKKGLTKEAEVEIADLHSRIKKIYARVNMDVRLSLIDFAFGLNVHC